MTKRTHFETVTVGAQDFAFEVTKAIEAPGNSIARREFVRSHTWKAKADAVWKQLVR